MSEVTAQTVERNGINLEFKPVQKKKGETAGEMYLGVTDKSVDYDTLVAFLGKDVAFDILLGRVNTRAQGWMKDATDENTGLVDIEKWSQFAKGISQSGESIKDLEAKLESLDEERDAVMLEFLPVFGKPEGEALGEQLKTLQSKIMEIKSAIAYKLRERKPKNTEGQPEAATANA
jgi:hypothetical protein